MNDKVNQRVIKSGEMMQGICIQWFIDEYGFSNDGKVNGFELYAAILRKTFGYRQKFNYISQSYFEMSPNKMKRHRDYLTEIGVLEWHTTKQMTMYRILEPADEIKTFRFSKQNAGLSEEDKLKEREAQIEQSDRELIEMLKRNM